MIYTSYFANVRRLPPEIVPVSIALYSPRWFSGLCYRKLAPTVDILREWKSNPDVERYVRLYQSDILARLSPYSVACDLMIMSEGKDVALLCYERPGDFCHRHLVADWLKRNGYECAEFAETFMEELTYRI